MSVDSHPAWGAIPSTGSIRAAKIHSGGEADLPVSAGKGAHSACIAASCLTLQPFTPTRAIHVILK